MMILQENRKIFKDTHIYKSYLYGDMRTNGFVSSDLNRKCIEKMSLFYGIASNLTYLNSSYIRYCSDCLLP